jgi:hypothetical protein
VRDRFKNLTREEEKTGLARDAEHHHHHDREVVQTVGDPLEGGAGKKQPGRKAGHRGAHDGGKPARRHGLDELKHDGKFPENSFKKMPLGLRQKGLLQGNLGQLQGGRQYP